MMDVRLDVSDKLIIVAFRTSEINIRKAKIIEKIISNLSVLDTDISVDLKGTKSIDHNGFKYLQAIFEKTDNIRIINLHDKYKKLVS